MNGTIMNWDDARGFGFIRPEQGGENVFFHISEWTDAPDKLLVGATVSYSLRQCDRGVKAVDVGVCGW